MNSNLTESRAIELIERHLGAAARPGRAVDDKEGSRSRAGRDARFVEVGIGDDAAVLRAPKKGWGRQVWTVDACLEGVHFERSWVTPEDIAEKSLNAAVSDIAAMGARPFGALCQVSLAPGIDENVFERFLVRQAHAAERLGCPILGGNLTAAPSFGVVTTVLGRLRRGEAPLLQSGARPGDQIWITGGLGLASLGYRILREAEPGPRPLGFGGGSVQARRDSWQMPMRACLEAFLRPRALVREGRRLVGRATACVDVSDGLAKSLCLLASHAGVRVVVDALLLERACDPHLVEIAVGLGLSPVSVMLEGGEDYALLAAGPAKKRPRGFVHIGHVEDGRGAHLESIRGREELRGGFEHAPSAPTRE